MSGVAGNFLNDIHGCITLTGVEAYSCILFLAVLSLSLSLSLSHSLSLSLSESESLSSSICINCMGYIIFFIITKVLTPYMYIHAQHPDITCSHNL